MRLLSVGLKYTGDPIAGTQIEHKGLCADLADENRSALPLYDYDYIIIYLPSFSHLLFGESTSVSGLPNELNDLRRINPAYDYDSAFDFKDRRREMEAALAQGSHVVWCMTRNLRQNFYGYRETIQGYLDPNLIATVRSIKIIHKRGRRIKCVDETGPFANYFQHFANDGWTICADGNANGYVPAAVTPEGYNLGGRFEMGSSRGWLLSPPTSPAGVNELIRAVSTLGKPPLGSSRFEGIFLSHTGADKEFVRRLKRDLMDRGVSKVWLDEAEIQIGDSLIEKIEEGLRLSKFVGVVLSPRSVKAPWVRKELEIALSREMSSKDVVVLPLLFENCEIPEFLRGKLYADFTRAETYDISLTKLLSRLRVIGQDASRAC